jgi:hypothetical protein
MHVPFKIHDRNNLIDKKDSYLIPRPPSWDDRNYSYGHQLYPSEYGDAKETAEYILSDIRNIYIKADRFPLMMLTAANKERKQI